MTAKRVSIIGNMSDGWLSSNKYEHVPVLQCTGPGTMMDGFAWKIVLHTTESRPGSIDAITSLFQAKPCYCPQFALDPSTGRRVQYIPWTWSGAALQGCHRGSQTNKGRAVQVELVGFADDTRNWPDEWLWVIGDWVADLVKDGLPVNLDRVADFGSMTGTLATEHTRYRLSEADYQAESGIIGHVNAHCNSHYDPGWINGFRIAEIAKQILGGAYQGPTGPASVGGLAPSGGGARPEHLQRGMEGGIVKFVQDLLIGMGFDCGPAGADSIFGDGTDGAVRAFQEAQGLEVDGVIGPKTQAAIAAAYGSGGGVPGPDVPAFPGRYLLVSSPMLEGDDVRGWQGQMSSRGWSVSVDGCYGPQSGNVCVQFQTEKAMNVDGVVGPMTWGATWSAPVT